MGSISNLEVRATSHSVGSSNPGRFQQRHAYVSFKELGAPFDVSLAESSSEGELSRTRKASSIPRTNFSAKVQSCWPKISGLFVPRKKRSTNVTATAKEDDQASQPTNGVPSNITMFELLSDSMVTSKNALMLRKETRIRFWLFSRVKTSIMYIVSARSDVDEYAEVAEFVYSGGKHPEKPGIFGKTRICLKKLARAFT